MQIGVADAAVQDIDLDIVRPQVAALKIHFAERFAGAVGAIASGCEHDCCLSILISR
jgi:hypothetical protein